MIDRKDGLVTSCLQELSFSIEMTPEALLR
jgi:hypothetical protein